MTYAASCAFYAFLSLFPLAALAASLVPCFGVDQAALLHLLEKIVPARVDLLLKAILANVYENIFPALPLSMLVLLWSSAQALSELLKGMNAMTGSDLQAGYLKRRLRAVLLTAALLITLMLSLSVLIFGARIAFFLGLVYPHHIELLRLFLWIRYLIMALLLWLLFVFLYRSIPSRRFSFREVRTGAAFAAVVWIIFTALFSLFADRFMNLTLYGNMAAMALAMLWLFYCQHIILIGAGICAVCAEKRKPSQ